MATIVELKQKSSYTHDQYGNEYKIPLDQMSEEELQTMLDKMNQANEMLSTLSKKWGWETQPTICYRYQS